MKKELSREWIEKLFLRLGEIYGERWHGNLRENFFRELQVTIWANGLAGISGDEIRRGLKACEFRRYEAIPHVIKFWHLCKGIKYTANIKRSRLK